MVFICLGRDLIYSCCMGYKSSNTNWPAVAVLIFAMLAMPLQRSQGCCCDAAAADAREIATCVCCDAHGSEAIGIAQGPIAQGPIAQSRIALQYFDDDAVGNCCCHQHRRGAGDRDGSSQGCDGCGGCDQNCGCALGVEPSKFIVGVEHFQAQWAAVLALVWPVDRSNAVCFGARRIDLSAVSRSHNQRQAWLSVWLK